MKSGYRILWTDNALLELKKTVDYLEQNWTERELKKLATQLEKTLQLISQNPYLFQASDVKKNVRRAVVLSVNSIYYRILKNDVEIISFFSNRQSPDKRKLK
ncbi:type II toxin-antitoxin system RelE/ParE family toxin [Flavobacterium azooxidireducens]|uniref:Type II toxin-antitoxin system RelE/ParE family toxin n=1 Tax=Flavobacterium azooxidireducens TaxID=1871076 RepID=A0ABY4KFI8_9FLAO|nr:type II toxin-antitoxin system RelE/ParE family toxin [Flavobacterium azooxidireducens]UPQ78217.1 type II toxin-antitoxin system RelE/ParE family toxin [Flavobacterium azooxidireducens]